MANLKELSEYLGLSQTTVSRALNGYPEVAESTRRRVAEAARQMDYAPNPSARGLATGKAMTIGHVMPYADRNMVDPHFMDFISGAGRIYQERGYDMLISVASGDNQAETYQKLKRDRRVDGVIVHGPLADDPRIEMLQELGIPFVVHGRTLTGPQDYAWVDVNNRRAFLTATRHLIDLGHERIALINGKNRMVFAMRRLTGFEDAMHDANLVVDPALIASDEMGELNGYQAMRGFLDNDNPPTAVLCASMLPGLGAIRAIQESGLQPGRDMAMVVYDDELSYLRGEFGDFSLSVMRSGIRVAGEMCANLLIDTIEGLETPAHIQLEAEFVEGTTSCPPRAWRKQQIAG